MLEEELKGIFKSSKLKFFNYKTDNLPEICVNELDTTKEMINNAINLQRSKAEAQKEAILKYMVENNVRVCEEEKCVMERVAELNKRVEKLKQEFTQLDQELKSVEVELSKEKAYARLLEDKQKNLLQEKDKVVQKMEKTRKAYNLALMTYERSLGMSIERDSSNRYIVTFRPHNLPKLSQLKIAFSRTTDGYQLADGQILSNRFALMKYLGSERRRWLSSP